MRRRLVTLRERLASPEAVDQVGLVRSMVVDFERRRVPARLLPRRVLDGDGRLENFAVGPSGGAVVLDLGFSAVRPRVHDLAYALTGALLGPDDSSPDWSNDVDAARACVAPYEQGTGET